MEKRFSEWNFSLWLALLLFHLVVVVGLAVANALKTDHQLNNSRSNPNAPLKENRMESAAKTLTFPNGFAI